jgi:hypothetical protein
MCINASRQRGEDPTWTSAPGAELHPGRNLTLSADWDHCWDQFRRRAPQRDSGGCAVARESVRFRGLMGLVIPPRIIQLAWDSLADAAATDREVALARWVLLSTLREGREG